LPVAIWDTNDRGFGHCGVVVQEVLDLARIYVLAATDDHVLESAHYPQVAVLVHHPQVSGV
jgi:hypothetical protein